MARRENVERVLAAIEVAYRDAKESKPADSEIWTAAGVSQKTYYRIKKDHSEVALADRLARSAFKQRSGNSCGETDTPRDPMKENPGLAIEELLNTIAHLTEVIEAQNVHADQLQLQLDTLRNGGKVRHSDLTAAESQPSRAASVHWMANRR